MVSDKKSNFYFFIYKMISLWLLLKLLSLLLFFRNLIIMWYGMDLLLGVLWTSWDLWVYTFYHTATTFSHYSFKYHFWSSPPLRAAVHVIQADTSPGSRRFCSSFSVFLPELYFGYFLLFLTQSLIFFFFSMCQCHLFYFLNLRYIFFISNS